MKIDLPFRTETLSSITILFKKVYYYHKQPKTQGLFDLSAYDITNVRYFLQLKIDACHHIYMIIRKIADVKIYYHLFNYLDKNF
ncbi:hypothetical protein FHS70_001686 [Flammeovirga yaeyamensis]|nr:hypothetical protein [Flammeovirga yaeyamensis]